LNKPAKKQRPIGLPSREDVVAFIAAQNGKAGVREIARAFGLKNADRAQLRHMLRDLADEGVVDQRRKKPHHAGTLPAVVLTDITERDRDGELIAVPTEWDTEEHGAAPRIRVHIPRKARSNEIPGVGDRALLRTEEAAEEGPIRHTGRVIKILDRSRQRQLGVFRLLPNGGGRLEPIDKKQLGREIAIPPGAAADAKDGDLVAVELTRHGRLGLQTAKVKERLGSLKSERAASFIALNAHEIPHVFRREALAEAESARPAGLEHREEWRDLPLVTIDPIDAKDHDDAVHAEPDTDPKNAGGFIVTVAIADVAHYVTPGSALDREALVRGNSVYFPDQVVPMLPERISNDLCSLRPNDPVIKPLYAAYAAIRRERAERQPLDLDLPERKILLKPDGTVDRVIVPPRLDAHRLIEEFMILANVAAAETLERARTPLIYRVHDEPAPEKLEALREFLATLDIRLAKGQALRPGDFNKILARVKGSEHEQLVNEVVLRTQAQAEYSAENYGHFGLNLRRYAHFTSPIRRYADLVVHRALIRALNCGSDGFPNSMDVPALNEIAARISAAERRAMKAERETADRLIANFLADRIGATFEGRISGVTRAGLFVKLDETGADGFVPARTIGDDYFRYNEGRHALTGDHTGESYRLGDTATVKLVEAAPVAGALRFEILSEGRHEVGAKRQAGRRRFERPKSGPKRAGRRR